MNGKGTAILVLLVLVLLLAAYSAYASTRVVVALEQVDKNFQRAAGFGEDVLSTARKLFRI